MIGIARRRISPTEREYEYVDLGLSSGLLWAKCNIGATTETDYGLYFSWGETDGYVTASAKTNGFTWESYKYNNDGSSPKASNMSKYNSTDKKTVLDLEDDAARVNMGGEWRMPTYREYQELLNNTTKTFVTNYNGTGVNGILLTSKTNQNAKLFFPANGVCSDGIVSNIGSRGNYFSSSLYTSNRLNSYSLYFNDAGSIYYTDGYRSPGYCVRGVRSSN